MTPFFKNFLWVFAGGKSQSIIRLLLHIYVAISLGPQAYGHYVFIMSVINYARILNFGVVDGMRRQVPYYLETSPDKISSVLSQTFWLSLILPGLFWIVFRVFFSDAFFSLFSHQSVAYKDVWMLASVIVVLSSVSDYFPGVLISYKKFKEAVVYRNALALTALVFALPLTALFHLKGIVWAWLIAYVVCIVWGVRKEGFPAFRLSFSEARLLLGFGLPLMATSILSGVLFNVDKVMIGYWWGVESVGHYGIAVILISALMSFGGIAASVLYPDMSSRFGRRDDPKDLYAIWWQPIFSMAVMVPLVLPVVYCLLPWVMKTWAPAYLPGLPAAQIILLGGLPVMMRSVTGHALISSGKQVFSLYVMAGSLGLAALLNYAVIRNGLGLEGIALATVGTLFVNFLISAGGLMRWMRFSWFDIFKKFLNLFGVMFCVLSVIVWTVWLDMSGFGVDGHQILVFTLAEGVAILLIYFYRPYHHQISYLRAKCQRRA